jgi:hypothetical protein
VTRIDLFRCQYSRLASLPIRHLINVVHQGRQVPAERHKQHSLLTRPLDRATAHQPSRARQQHDHERHPRIVCQGTGQIVLELRIKSRQVQLVIDQLVQGEFERARLNLLGQHAWNELRVAINDLVARHLHTSLR